MNILFVDAHSDNPFDIRYGSIQRTNLLIRACARCGHVDVVVFSEKKVISDIDNCDVIKSGIRNINPSVLSEINRKISLVFYDSFRYFGYVNRRMERCIDVIVEKGNYDWIVTRYVSDAVKCGLLKYGKRLVIDIDDSPLTVRKNYLGKGSTFMHNIYRQLMYRKSQRMMEKLLKRIHCAFFSNADDLLDEKSVYLPNIPYYEINSDYCDFSKTNNRILFVGFVDFKPNIEGLTHFINNIFPLVRNRVPDVELSIVGKYNIDSLPSSFFAPNILVKGFVEDLSEEYEQSRVAIVPIYTGAGTNIKVLEAFQMKRPCVTTPFGARGHSRIFENDKDFFVSETDEDFAKNVTEMLLYQESNNRISKNANVKVKKYYSRDYFNKVVNDVIVDM